MTKAIIDFSHFTGAELLPIATTIHDQLLLNATTFPKLPTDTATLGLLIESFEQALVRKSSRATADFIAFNVARANLEAPLGGNGAYVNIVAKGDPIIVVKSGYPSYETGTTPDYSPPGPPANVTLRHGTVTGSIVGRYRPTRRRSVNEVQICMGDPNVEENWKPAGIFHGGKAMLTGFEPGTIVWVRFRTIGLNNVMGAWSDPAKIMVV